MDDVIAGKDQFHDDFELTPEEKSENKAIKNIGQFYSYFHIIKMLSDDRQEVNTSNVLSALDKKAFFRDLYEGKSKSAKAKIVQRLVADLYTYHGSMEHSDLSHSNVIERIKKGNSYAYFIAKGKSSPLADKMFDSMLPLKLIEDELMDFFLPNMKKDISEVLSLVVKPKSDVWEEKFFYKSPLYDLISPKVNESYLLTIEKAVENNSVIESYYKDRVRKLDPYGIFVYGKVLYLVAGERVNKDGSAVKETDKPKLYAIHRMEDVKELHNFHLLFPEKKNNFSIEEFISSSNGSYFNGGEEVSAEIKCFKDINGKNKFIDEFKISECQKVENHEHHFIVTAKVRNCLDFKKWLITHSSYVEILKPLDIRKDVAKMLNKASEVYSNVE